MRTYVGKHAEQNEITNNDLSTGTTSHPLNYQIGPGANKKEARRVNTHVIIILRQEMVDDSMVAVGTKSSCAGDLRYLKL